MTEAAAFDLELTSGLHVHVTFPGGALRDAGVARAEDGTEYLVRLVADEGGSYWQEAALTSPGIIRPGLMQLCLPYLDVVSIGRLREHWSDVYLDAVSRAVDGLIRRTLRASRPQWFRRTHYVALVRPLEPFTLERMLDENDPSGPHRARIAARVIAATAEAHRCGIVHGDIQTYSFVGQGSRWRLTDFGLAIEEQSAPMEQLFGHDVRQTMRVVSSLFGAEASPQGAVSIDPTLCAGVSPMMTDLVREIVVMAEHAALMPTAQELDDAIRAADTPIAPDLWPLVRKGLSSTVEREILATNIQDAQLAHPLCRTWYYNIYSPQQAPVIALDATLGTIHRRWAAVPSYGAVDEWIAKGPDPTVTSMLREVHLESLLEDPALPAEEDDFDYDQLLADELRRWNELRDSILRDGFRRVADVVEAGVVGTCGDVVAALYRGELVAIEEHGEVLLPEFLFSLSAPALQVIFVCNGILGTRGPSWTLADWWFTGKEELDGLEPRVAILDPDRWADVVDAAFHDGDLTAELVD